MDNLERLERLNHLRESGGLTEAEFEIEKARLLANPAARHRRALWTGVAAIGVLALAVVAFLMLRKPDADSLTDNTSAERAASININSARQEMNVAAPSEQPLTGYAWATSAEVLNANPAFLEARLGPAREKTVGYMLFDIGGCRVSYTIESSAVRSLSAPVTRGCQPSLSGTPARAIRLSPSTTFGQIQALTSGGIFSAGCLEMCGNAADPTVELTIGGSHAEGFIRVSFSSVAAGEHDALSGLLLWAEAARRQRGLGPQDFLPSDANSCAENPPANVIAALRPARISEVSVDLAGSTGGCR